MAAPLVLALGGSLLGSEGSERDTWLTALAELLEAVEVSIGIVVGGGVAARDAIDQAMEDGENDLAALDEIGITATRMNAAMVAQFLQNAGLDVCAEIPHDVESSARGLVEHSLVVMGGTRPGHTTDNVAICLAIEAKAARCLIATNVGHVYSSDPRVDSGALPIESMTLSELQDIVGPPVHGQAGGSAVIDPIGVQAAIDNNLPLSVVDGREMERMANALGGKPFIGTSIEVE